MGTKNKSPGSQHNPKGVTQGVTLVDPKSGNPIDTVTDSNGVRRIAVDGNFVAQNVQASVELEYSEDSVAIGDPNTDTTLKINPDGSIDSNVEIDAADGDSVAISSHINQIFTANAATLTSSNFEEIFSYASSSDNTRLLLIECTVSTPSRIQIKIDGNIVREQWTSPLERNVKFQFMEHRKLLTGQILTVEAQVERFIHSNYETFTSMEGYLL